MPLPRLALAAAPTIADMAAPALRAHIAAGGVPLRLPGLVRHWPARAWDAPGLGTLRHDVGEDTAVDVEVGRRGRGYRDPGWQRVTMGFGLFLDAFVLGTIPSANPSALPAGYLAQAPLLDRPALQAAAPALEHYKGPQGDVYGRTLWVGPRGSFTPFHRDPNVGLYTQIVGRKVFHLLPPEAGELMRPGKGVHQSTSAVPVSVRRVLGGVAGGEGSGEEGGARKANGEEKSDSDADADGEPLTAAEQADFRALLSAAFEMPGACAAHLGPGDSVLIPQGWWHSAEGESVGVGVNAWFR